ncbi:helix-turn-helix domain-containing protein [Nocardia asteroides]|uniref:helix-turn-helix domain-containing protein n=1 Tax=Nocardia asteroides TaxID=1824 RepID=UPI0036508E6B
MSNTLANTPDIESVCQNATVSIEDAGKLLGVSRSYAYEMARTGHLPTIVLGVRRRRVPTAALLRMLQVAE